MELQKYINSPHNSCLYQITTMTKMNITITNAQKSKVIIFKCVDNDCVIYS